MLPVPAAGWIDLHTHILPGLDDGAQDLMQALAMARLAQADGISCLVATPHNLDWPAHDCRPIIQRRVADLNIALRDAGLTICVLPGVEAYLWPNLGEQVRSGVAFPLAQSNHILVELPASAYPLYTEQTIFELQVMGWSVILAHPERNIDIQRQPQRLEPLVARGVLVQITAASILGGFGAQAQRSAQDLLRKGWVHLIASDAHDAARRAPLLRAAVQSAGALVGPERAEAMVSAVPRAILRRQGLNVESPAPVEKRSWWSRLFQADGAAT